MRDLRGRVAPVTGSSSGDRRGGWRCGDRRRATDHLKGEYKWEKSRYRFSWSVAVEQGSPPRCCCRRMRWTISWSAPRPTTSDLPKAHVLNQRAMETLDDVGAAEAIARLSTPAVHMAATAYYAGFAGPDPEYGRRLHRLESWGAGGADESWRAASSQRQLNLPQIRLEPLLKARADELAPGKIRFNHELLELEQDESSVRALIRDKNSDQEYAVRSEYLLGADGGNRIAGLIGVEYEGLGVVTQTATLHVSADFSRWAKDPDVLIRWVLSPQSGTLVVMVPMGPEHWGPDSEEWVIHLNYPAGDPRALADETDRTRCPRSTGHIRPAPQDPQDHQVDGRCRDGIGVRGGTGVPLR